MKRIVVSVTNDLVTDQRVYKVCKTLYDDGFDIFLIGRKHKNSPKLKRPYKCHRIKLLFNKGPLFYAEYNFRLFFFLLFCKKDILLSNDLDSLLPNYLLSKIQQKDLVFDSHELFSELPSVQGRFSQKVWKKLEQWLLPKLKHFFTVSDSIATWFETEYNNKPLVLINLPHYKDIEFTNPKENYLLYQGALNDGRGLIPLIEAMKSLNNITLKIAGKGPFQSQIENKIKECQLGKKVELLGNIEPKKLVQITQNATIGISLEEDIGLSYRYSLPNKLFDYIQAKTPVLSTYLPEIKKVVSYYNIGEVIESHNPKNIAESINTMLNKGKSHYNNNLDTAAKDLTWENQADVLLTVFRNL